MKLLLVYRSCGWDVISYLRPCHRVSHQEGSLFLTDFKLDCFFSKLSCLASDIFLRVKAILAECIIYIKLVLMSKACNDTWNSKKGRSFLEVNMLPSFSPWFWKDLLSQHLKSTAWNKTNVPTCFVCCAISCWKPIVNGAFVIFIRGNVFVEHKRRKKPKPQQSPHCYFFPSDGNQ